MRMHNYNNFLAFAFSHCKNNNHYNNSLLIFSYPNSTDKNVDLILKLFPLSNNSDLYINLKNETRIENNLFGYIFSGIMIYSLDNCDNLNLISSISNNAINQNYRIKKIKFIMNSFAIYNIVIK